MKKSKLPKADMPVRSGFKSDISPQALQRWCPDVRAAMGEDDAATISVLDPIGSDMWGDGVTAKRIAGALRAIGPNPVAVNINSPGGDYFEGLAIYNLLREHAGEVTVNILGIAASAASVIAMAGDTVNIARSGFLMIHNTRIGAGGDRHALRQVADWLEPFDTTAVDIYAARTGIDAATLAAMLDAETWIGGKSAIEQGFADALLSADLLDSAPQDAASASLRAERKFDLLASKAGLTNTARREMLRALKSGQPGADPSGMPGAANVEQGLQDLLKDLKSF
ncbi:head maturation protease, ClpP-related [Falsihalocynthiibacter arcticus]|uniref:head maturation protease, ClpP-related n=1 Tax=Falsihalocynthiibacter arcticus TaxID=1579316 RepID=UPI003000FF6D